jgi:UDP-perosamine 4-acetyltransferase
MAGSGEARCLILGGGGHARVLIDALQAAGSASGCAILDQDRSRWGEDVLGVPILGDDSLIPGLVRDGTRAFVVGLGSVGDNAPRRRLFELALSHGLEPLSVLHPSALCSRWARIGRGSQLLPGAIVNAGASVGDNVIVNSGAIVEHDCVLGDHVHVATGARLASGVRVGDGAHIGAGAVVRQGLVIGEGSLVGAGAVVVKEVAPRLVVVGVPARTLRTGLSFAGARGGQPRRGR